METLFIKKLVNKELFCLSETNDENKEDYEYIINIDNIDNTNLNEEEEKVKDSFIAMANEELNRINAIVNYFSTNINVNKVFVPYYKVYDYSNTPNNLKRKINTHNHIFDIKKFILKNNIDKNKNMAEFILSKIFELLSEYNKCLLYSLLLLKEHPYLIRYKTDYLVSINPTLFTIINDEINIHHHNKIKNAYIKNDDKKPQTNTKSTIIKIIKNKNNIYEITFK